MCTSNVFDAAERSVLILSSSAAGDRSAAAAIAERLVGAAHYAVEDLVGPELRAADFEGGRVLPFGYWYKWARAQRTSDLSQLDVLGAVIRRHRVRTVVATSHRAAFWVAELKRRGLVHCALWAVATDFYIGSQWRWLHWDEVDRFLGVVPASAVPAGEQRVRYRRIALPVQGCFESLSKRHADRQQVLVAAGRRGVAIAAELVAARADIVVHLACGDDGDLYERAFTRFHGHRRVHVYAFEPSLWPLMSLSGAVVARAGALTLAEAAWARRALFVVPPRGAHERANAEWAARVFGAAAFSVRALVAWQRGQRAGGAAAAGGRGDESVGRDDGGGGGVGGGAVRDGGDARARDGLASFPPTSPIFYFPTTTAYESSGYGTRQQRRGVDTGGARELVRGRAHQPRALGVAQA